MAKYLLLKHYRGAPASANDVDAHSITATAALLDRVAVHPGDRVLELAAGPGSLGDTWSRLLGVTGRVLISDIAPGMVEVARRRNAALDNVDVAILDASTIDQPDASYDVVACRMGLMFTPDPEVAVAEIHRVLAPGGRFGALTWGPMEHNPWMTCVGMAAMLHGLVSGGPPVGPTRRTGDGRRLRRCEGGRVRRHTPGVRSTRSQLTNFNEQL